MAYLGLKDPPDDPLRLLVRDVVQRFPGHLEAQKRMVKLLRQAGDRSGLENWSPIPRCTPPRRCRNMKSASTTRG